MKQFYSITSIYPFLFFVAIITSCNSQNLSKEESVPIPSRPMDSLETVVPRWESHLEFKSMITSIFEDSKGNFWLGSHGDGVCRYPPSALRKTGEQAFAYFTSEQGLVSTRIHEGEYRKAPMGDLIQSIQEDQEGNIWIQSADGFNKYDGQNFTTVYPEKENLLITESFNGSAEDWEKEFNYLWFGNAGNNGAYRYDGQKLEPVIFPIPEGYNNGFRSQYATYSLYKDRDKNIWFGTESGGIMRYDGTSFTCINQTEEKGTVRAFFQDKSGKIWISNVLQGLYYYDHAAHLKGQKSFINFTKEQGYFSLGEVRSGTASNPSKMLDGIQSIAQDAEGNMWFGTYSDGLWRYDGVALTHYTEENGFMSNTIKTIYKDKKGKLWFGIGQEKTHLYHFNGISFDKFGE